MNRSPKSGVVRETATDHEMRDQEVLRANRELAAYFRGRRTEREARAALKIVKAFIRERERADAKSRRPLPGLEPTTRRGSAKMAKAKGRRKKAVAVVPVANDTPSEPSENEAS
jgi:hypothetical protein